VVPSVVIVLYVALARLRSGRSRIHCSYCSTVEPAHDDSLQVARQLSGSSKEETVKLNLQ
jgi:hypothetical protein